MQKNWQVGTLFNIPLYIDRSWFLVLLLITSVDANDLAVKTIAGSTAIAWLLGFAMAILLFTSVLFHELGHSLMAKAQNIKVRSITLFLFGGLASIERESKTPFEAFAVAIAGPLVSFLIFGLGSGVKFVTPDSSLINFLASDISRINLILALFNLIPGLPLDGGQVMKAIVWKQTGDRVKGVLFAATAGKAIGIAAIAGGLLFCVTTNNLDGLWISLLGWFVLRNAGAYERVSDLQTIIQSLTAKDIMSRDFRVVDAHLTLLSFMEKYIFADSGKESMKAMYASSEGRYRGLVRISKLQAVERSLWETKELRDIALPLDEIESVTEKSSLAEVICKLEKIEDSFVTVLSPAGAVAGIADRAQVTFAIAKEYGLQLSHDEVQTLRSERVYPKDFPVVEIAKELESEI